MRWSDFLKAHLGHIFAADFFTVEVLTAFGLVRYHVLFFIDIATRRVHIGGVIHGPDGFWMKQQVLDLTNPVDGFLWDAKYLILDRDPICSKDVKGRLEDEGVKVVTLPAKSPNLNAYAERFVLSIKSGLSKIIPLGERHLRHCVQEFSRQYHQERPRQGLGNRLIEPAAAANGDGGRVGCRERLSGVLRFYHRHAA